MSEPLSLNESSQSRSTKRKVKSSQTDYEYAREFWGTKLHPSPLGRQNTAEAEDNPASIRYSLIMHPLEDGFTLRRC